VWGAYAEGRSRESKTSPSVGSFARLHLRLLGIEWRDARRQKGLKKRTDQVPQTMRFQVWVTFGKVYYVQTGEKSGKLGGMG